MPFGFAGTTRLYERLNLIGTNLALSALTISHVGALAARELGWNPSWAGYQLLSDIIICYRTDLCHNDETFLLDCSEKMNMFGTQNLRNAMVIGDISPLPHSRDVRGRSEALEKEKDLYRSRAMAESKQRAAFLQYERQQKEELQRRREQEMSAELDRKSREAAAAAMELQQQSQSKRRQSRNASDEKASRKEAEISAEAHNDAKGGVNFNDISTFHAGQSYLYGSNEMDSTVYEHAVDPAVRLNFSAVFSQVDEEKDRSLDVYAAEDGSERHTNIAADGDRADVGGNGVRDFNESIVDEHNYTADADFESESDTDAKEEFTLEDRMLSLSNESYDHTNANSFLADGLDVAEEVGDDVDMVVGLDISILNSSISRRQTERSKINEEDDFDGCKTIASLERPDAMISTIIRRSVGANAPLKAADTSSKAHEVSYNYPSAEVTAYFSQLAQLAHSFATTKSPSDKKQLLAATRRKAFGSKLDTLFTAHSTMWQYHMQPPEFQTSDSDLIVHPSKLASTLIDALVVTEQSLECSLAQLSDICSEKEKAQQKLSEDKIFFTFSALNVIANSCKIVQAFLNLSEGLLKHVVQQDFAMLNRKMVHSERIWNQVLAACSSLLGLFILIPIEEELFSYSSVKLFLEQYRVHSGGGIELELAYGGVIGLSVSDRWCLVTLAGEVLKECNNLRSEFATESHEKSSTTAALDTTSNNQVSLNTLSSLAKVFASSSPDLFNMLLAQQLPSILCDSIFVDSTSTSKTHRQKEAASQQPWSGFAFLKTVNARVVHTLSVLLRSSHNAVYPTPLESAMQQRQRKRSSSVADQNDPQPPAPIDFESASTHVMLRQRVCRLLGERLTDRNCKKLNAVLEILFQTFSPRLSSFTSERPTSHRGDKLSHPVKEDDVYNVFLLRADTLTLLIHVSYFFGRYVCLSICQYHSGSVVSALINSIGVDEAMLGASSEVRQRQLMHCIGHAKALSLQLLRYLCMYSTLQESHLLASVNACVECFNDDLNTGDKKVSGCALSLLACIYKFSAPASELTAAGNQNSMKARSLLAYVERTVVSSKVLDVIVDLLSYLFTSSEKESRIEQCNTDMWNIVRYTFGNNDSQASKMFTKGDPRFWVLGYEFGLRQHGMLDGVLELLSLIGASAEARDDSLRGFMTGPLAMSLAEMICQQIQCAVSALSIDAFIHSFIHVI